MKKLLFILVIRNLCIGLFIISTAMSAQQNVQYTQFMLNDYGLDPAVAGSSKGLMFLVGRRVQWAGYALAQETNVASVTKGCGKKGWKRYGKG